MYCYKQYNFFCYKQYNNFCYKQSLAHTMAIATNIPVTYDWVCGPGLHRLYELETICNKMFLLSLLKK